MAKIRQKLLCQKNVAHTKGIGTGALSGEMLLVRIVENNEIYAYFRAGYVK